jgi:hypothetical protein
MTCTIKFNKSGGIDNVFTPNGGESKLFKQIAKLPHTSSLEEALETFKNVYSEKINISNQGLEPSLIFKSDKGGNFNSFKDALKDSTGGIIEIGIPVDGNFMPLQKVSSNTNTKTYEGFVNSLIKEDVLSDEKIIEDGKTYHKADGIGQILQLANEQVIKEEANVALGKKNVKVHLDGRIELRGAKNKVEVNNKVTTTEEIAMSSLEDLQSKFGKAEGEALFLNKLVQEVMPSGLSGETIDADEDSLKLRLLDLLNSMGVKIMSIDNYVKNYETRNGVSPDAKTLLDVAQQVIAYRDGAISTEGLLEETAHFIVETWEDSEIENILRNIHKTQTYQELSQQYREVYMSENPNMSEEEVENLVRREILGKELAKGLQNRFSTEGKTEIQSTILSRIFELFKKFFDSISLTENVYDDIAKLTTKVEDLLITKNINNYLNLEKAKGKKFRMYQLNQSGDPALDAKASVSKQLVRALIEQEKNLRRAGRGSRATIQKLNEILEKEITKSSALDLIALAKSQARYVGIAIDNANKKGRTLSNEEGIVLRSLKDEISPLLSKLRVLVENDPQLNSLVPDLAAVETSISGVTAKVQLTETRIIDEIINRLMVRNNLSDDLREELEKAVEVAIRDTQMVYAYFGQLSHANDPILGMLSTVISDMNRDAELSYIGRVKSFQMRIRDLGFTEKDLSQFFDEDGYITSMYDWSKFEADILKIKVDNFQKYSGHKMTDEEIIEGINTNSLPKIKEVAEGGNETAYKDEVSKAISDLVERSFTDEYYQEREARYAGVSEATRVELRLLSMDLGELMSRVKTEKGLPRFTLQDKHNLDGLNLKRKQLKSFFNLDGTLKKGLRKVDFPSADSIEVNGTNYVLRSNPSSEARLAFEITKLDIELLQQKKDDAAKAGQKIDVDKLAPKFLEELNRIEQEEGREAAVEFFLLNATVGFSNEFWDSFNTSQTLMTQLDLYEQDINADSTVLKRIEEYKESLDQRKAILKQFQDSKNYTNILSEDIPVEVRKNILELSERIDNLYSELYRTFKNSITEDISNEQEERLSEVTPNQSYYDTLSDKKITEVSDKIKFAMENMTVSNSRKVRKLQEALEDFVKGRQMTEASKKLIENIVGRTDIVEEEINDIVLRYAESKLALYYKAFAPVGLSEFYNNLKKGNSSVFGLVSSLNSREDVKVSNNFSYYEMGEIKYKNKNYREDFEGGSRQPKLSKYANQRFIQMFNPKRDAENNPILDADGNMEAGSNKELFELYKEYINFQKDTLRSYGELGLHNLYLAPQISKTSFNKTVDTLKNPKTALKDMWQDFLRFRVDEQAFGDEVNKGEAFIKKEGFRTIPKYFLNKLSDRSFVSQDLFYTSSLMAQQAELYKAKKERFSEFATLNDKALNRAYPGGKSAEATNTYKMFKSYMDYNLFGVKEVRNWRVNLPVIGQVDVTKVINTLHNWLRNNSLGRNFIVPITSWITAEASLLIERKLSQYVDPNSYSLASREFYKLSTPAMKESLELNSRAKLSLMGEYFGIFDLDRRFENSQYSKAPRALSRSMYILHTAGNFVPLSKGMLSQLYGNRIYNGKIVDFEQFKVMFTNANGSKVNIKDVEAEWKKIQDKAFYNYILTEDKNGNPYPTMTYDFDALANDMNRTNDEEFRKDFRNIELGVISKTKKLIERIDGQITNEERTTLQRDVLGRFAMTHKGWLSISASNRFKRRHINFQTGKIEEGTYLTAANYFVDAINLGYKKGKLKGIMQEFKDLYVNGDETTRKNLERVAKETLFLSLLFLLTIGLSSWADDEEDLWGAQLTAYLFERTTTEVSSSQLGIFGEFYASFKEPIVGLQKIENLVRVDNLLSTEVVDRGRYQGLTDQQVYLIKNIVGAKPMFDIWNAENLKSQRDSYDHFNKEEALIPVAWFLDEEDL